MMLYGILFSVLLASAAKSIAQVVGTHPPEPCSLHIPTPVNESVVELDYSEPEAAKKSNDLLEHLLSSEHQEQAHNIRSLKVCGYASLGNLELVSKLVNRADHLQDVHWRVKSPIPKDITKSLDSRKPAVKLHYTMPFHRMSDWNYDPYENQKGFFGDTPQSIFTKAANSRSIASKSITGSTSLYSLKASIIYGGKDNTEDMELISSALYSCPNIRELDLYLGHEGCVVGGINPYAFNFVAKKSSAKFPPLEALKLHGYDFEEQPNGLPFPWPHLWEEGRRELKWPWNNLPDQIIDIIGYSFFSDFGFIDYDKRRPIDPNVKKPIDNLDVWLKRMDWSRLHTLSLANPEYKVINRLLPNLPSLKHISLSNPGRDCIDYVLTNATSPLESIRLLSVQNVQLPSFDAAIDNIGLYHNSSVKNLALCGYESSWSDGPYPISLRAKQIQRISSISPEIISLEISLARPENNETAKFSFDPKVTAALASFSQLERLTLRFPSAHFAGGMNWDRSQPWRSSVHLKDGAEPDDAIINARSVPRLFAELRKQQQEARQLKEGKEKSQALEAKLKELYIYSGDWDDRYTTGMASKPLRMVAQWVCGVDQDSKEVCKGEEMLPKGAH